MVVIEMNPRVSRSSALASKATGFPIAKIAAKLALGYHLDEIPNDITRLTPASFEPTIDHDRGQDSALEFREVSAGRLDAHHADEIGGRGDGHRPHLQGSVHEGGAVARAREERPAVCAPGSDRSIPGVSDAEDDAALRKRLVVPHDRRMWDLFWALGRGWSVERIHELTKIDPWFLRQFADINEMHRQVADTGVAGLDPDWMRRMKRAGFGDAELAQAAGVGETVIRERRVFQGLQPVYKRVDTCAAEFESFTPYLYSSYEPTCEANPNARRKVVILGSGPNRIGQGIEFDYCCCHAAFALREEGLETVMINCNPETVSTDYDTADRLYFQPLTFEDVMAVLEKEGSAGGEVSCSCSSAGRRRSSSRSHCRRPACGFSGLRPIRSISRKIASGSRRCCCAGYPQPATVPPPS